MKNDVLGMGQQFRVHSRLMFMENALMRSVRIRLEMKIVQPLPEVKGCTRVIYEVLEKQALLEKLQVVFNPNEA